MELSGRAKSFYFTRGNRKLSKDVLIWNLPRGITCRGMGECAKWCYEIKIERMYPNVRKSRMRNLEFAQREDFAERIIEYLSKRKEKIIRLFESGDFFNQKHLDDWCRIASALKDKVFYAYTKSHDLDFSRVPDNLRIIRSYGSKWDYLIDPTVHSTSRVIDNVSERMPNEFICPEQLAKKRGKNVKCGSQCQLCWKLQVAHVCFLRH